MVKVTEVGNPGGADLNSGRQPKYRVEGSINAIYTDILISRICSSFGEMVNIKRWHNEKFRLALI